MGALAAAAVAAEVALAVRYDEWFTWCTSWQRGWACVRRVVVAAVVVLLLVVVVVVAVLFVVHASIKHSSSHGWV